MRDADAGQRERADQHRGERPRDFLSEAAHHAHVLLMVHGVDDRAGAEEQERLEEGVREEMEDAGAISSDAASDEHVAELRAGRIGNDALDVVLHEADGRGEERRDRADQRHELQCVGRQLEDRRKSRDHEDAGGHHRGGMDERRDGRRAFHGVRQPGVEQELRGLAHRAHEEQQRERRQDVDVVARKAEGLADCARHGRKQRVEIHRVEDEKEPEDAERETEVADAVDDESFDRRRIGGGLFVPESDEQIGREADAFPAEEHLYEVVRSSPASASRR